MKSKTSGAVFGAVLVGATALHSSAVLGVCIYWPIPMKYWRREDSVDSLFTGFTNAQILAIIHCYCTAVGFFRPRVPLE